MRKTGFTLAEVLLTLTIIGVVAAMTVPNLMGAVEDKELAAQAKKAYNTLQNAISMKYSLTRLTPGDVAENQLFSSLLAGDQAPTLKYIERSGNIVQTPDGAIMRTTGGSTSCDSSTNAACIVKVDVNGSDGPNFSQAGATANQKNAAGMTLVQLSSTVSGGTTYNRAQRDIVYFIVDGLSVTPNRNHGVTARYFTGKK